MSLRLFLASTCAAAILRFCRLLDNPMRWPQNPRRPRPGRPIRLHGRRTAEKPDLQGIWNNGTVTRLERPADLGDKVSFTPDEARQYEKDIVTKSNRDVRTKGTVQDVSNAYNDAWWDSGSKVTGTLRTSMVIDPPNGKLPPLTADGERMYQDRRLRLGRPAQGPEDRTLAERCLMFPTDSVPMLPHVYNNNMRIVQSKDSVAILTEMVHDVRVIPLDGRPHLPENVRNWFGDSRGHWEGDTLVVDTTNFSGKSRFGFDNVTSPKLHVVEWFTRVDPQTILYRFTVDDPGVYTKPWTAELTYAADPGPIFEYACHEGNYGLPNMLSGARAEEKASK